MKRQKITTILENYQTLTKDIYKIEQKTKFLKEKKKDLEDVLINYFNENKIDQLSNVSMITNIRREPLSKKYIENTLKKYYRNYFLSNKSKLGNTDITIFTNKKTQNILKYLLKNRTAKKYYRLKINH